ncbi:MAG: hypothetical protein HFF65_00370 [Oscillospiraceae bacterium]|nr:hypothetical protein [Oscillospiraceae bacterium]
MQRDSNGQGRAPPRAAAFTALPRKKSRNTTNIPGFFPRRAQNPLLIRHPPPMKAGSEFFVNILHEMFTEAGLIAGFPSAFLQKVNFDSIFLFRGQKYGIVFVAFFPHFD